MTKKIVFSAGGTGGHILPAVKVMKHFYDKGYKVLMVTDSRGSFFLKNYPEINSYIIKTDTATNKNFLRKVLSIFIIIKSIIKSAIILKKEKPNLVFGFGGYSSFPICFTSKFFGIPLMIYENNMILGRANRYLLLLCKKIFVAKNIGNNFPHKFNKKLIEAGPILDKSIINSLFEEKKNSKKNFSILVLGGSQGAEVFGNIVPNVIKMVNDQGYSIHIKQQCIEKQKEEIINFYKKNNIKADIFVFRKDILKLMSASNLAITRCGASSSAELMQTLTPFIAVPLPNSIDNHQYLNAKYYENKGYCWLLEQEKFNTENLYNLIIKIIKNEKILEDVSENMKKDYSKNAYINIENEIKEFT